MGEALGLIFSPRILINFIIKNLQIKKLCAEINFFSKRYLGLIHTNLRKRKYKSMQFLYEKMWRFSKKLRLNQPEYPAIELLGR